MRNQTFLTRRRDGSSGTVWSRRRNDTPSFSSAHSPPAECPRCAISVAVAASHDHVKLYPMSCQHGTSAVTPGVGGDGARDRSGGGGRIGERDVGAERGPAGINLSNVGRSTP